MKIITYSTNKDTDSKSIENILRSQGTFAKFNDSTWLIGGDLTYLQLRDLLTPFNPSNLVIIAVKNNFLWSACNLEFVLKNWLDNTIG